MDGEEITIKGQVKVDTVTRLDLFDGLFTTGYRLTSFEIAAQIPKSTNRMWAKLMTLEEPQSDNWNWDNNAEIAWAIWNVNSHDIGTYNRVDEDMSIIEDLFLDVGGNTATDFVNYIITMRKVTFPIGIGAMNMVRNQSQGPTT